jgi:hypothetical protein
MAMSASVKMTISSMAKMKINNKAAASAKNNNGEMKNE